ncbi:hypothetical protein YC2023_101607 [Brassica napus]
MANSYTLLANLRAGQCSNTAEVRLLRIPWFKGVFLLFTNVSSGNVLLKDQFTPSAGTDFEKLVATARTIPTEHFRFRPHEQIIELANTSRQLLDVIGEVFPGLGTAAQNPLAHYLCGMQESSYENIAAGGDPDIGIPLLDSLGWRENKARSDACWQNIKTSLHGVRVKRSLHVEHQLMREVPEFVTLHKIVEIAESISVESSLVFLW